MYEYKVIPAPRRAEKNKSIRNADNRYAHTLANIMNAEAAHGWMYLRTETLPVDEKSGIMGKTSEKYLNVMVFQRELEAEQVQQQVQETYEPRISSTPSQVASDPHLLSNPALDENLEQVANLGPAVRD